MSPESTVFFVGIDLHKDSARVAVLRGFANEFHDERTLPGDALKIVAYLTRLAKTGPVHACYEASGCGYILQRALSKRGIRCDVIAPSLVAQKAGERRKTDRIDACKLARQLRNGDLVAIRVPTEAQERERELVRCRDAVRMEVHRSRQHILKLLQRRDVRPSGRAWTVVFWQWLRKLELPDHDQTALRTYIALLDTKLLHLGELDAAIAEVAKSEDLAGPVGRLRCLRGIDTLSAMVLVTELGDTRRFGDARALMSYVGLGVAEYSSGGREQRYGITKSGSARCRRVLIEAAWSYLHRPALSGALKARQSGQSPQVITHAWRAQTRLHKRFRRLEARMPRQKAVTAVARELAGFVWALMREEPELLCAAPNRR